MMAWSPLPSSVTPESPVIATRRLVGQVPAVPGFRSPSAAVASAAGRCGERPARIDDDLAGGRLCAPARAENSRARATRSHGVAAT